MQNSQSKKTVLFERIKYSTASSHDDSQEAETGI